MFELAMTAAGGREEPAVILKHSKYLADFHQIRRSGDVYVRGYGLLRHIALATRTRPMAVDEKRAAPRMSGWAVLLSGHLMEIEQSPGEVITVEILALVRINANIVALKIEQ